MRIVRSFAAALVFISGLLSAGTGVAGNIPKKLELVYQATRNDQPFAKITETYRQENGRYQIESVTEGIGVYALFGKRRLISEGEVTPDGLRPKHFELHQGDNAKRSLINDFDWGSNTLTLQVKGKTSSVPLQKGTQDLSSFIYQFMFAPPKGDVVDLPVTTGKKLRNYHYRVADRDVSVTIEGKQYNTIHVVDASKDAEEDQKEFWLSIDHNYLPVHLEMKDESGAKIEQTLTSLHAE